jgi:hypothetical protein
MVKSVFDGGIAGMSRHNELDAQHALARMQACIGYAFFIFYREGKFVMKEQTK